MGAEAINLGKVTGSEGSARARVPVFADRLLASECLALQTESSPVWLCVWFEASPERRPRPHASSSLVGHLAVQVLPDAPIGRFGVTVAVRVTDTKSERALMLECSGEVVDDIQVSPSRLVVMGDSARPGASVSISSNSGPLDIEAVRSEGVVSYASWLPRGAAAGDVSIGFVPTWATRGGEGSVTVLVMHPRQCQITVPVVVLHRSR
ncbi:MAG: hypothetical protein BWY79_02129 [Actinobacteria bacterium ADurb.Bin444]|nr:MAG: hypothetical protein BWY79_02129 [Actinobacteria bacterium ADurb.Bin444]